MPGALSRVPLVNSDGTTQLPLIVLQWRSSGLRSSASAQTPNPQMRRWICLFAGGPCRHVTVVSHENQRWYGLARYVRCNRSTSCTILQKAKWSVKPDPQPSTRDNPDTLRQGSDHHSGAVQVSLDVAISGVPLHVKGSRCNIHRISMHHQRPPPNQSLGSWPSHSGRPCATRCCAIVPLGRPPE